MVEVVAVEVATVVVVVVEAEVTCPSILVVTFKARETEVVEEDLLEAATVVDFEVIVVDFEVIVVVAEVADSVVAEVEVQHL